MIAAEVAKRYGRALYDSARERNLTIQGHDQLAPLIGVFRDDRRLIDYLSAPHVLEETKEELVKRIFGDRLEALFVEFLLLLVRKHRIRFLPEILEEVERLFRDDKGILQVTVTSAVILTAVEEERIREALERKTGKTIELIAKVDPSLIAGLIVKIGDDVVDGSVKHQLASLKDELERVRVY